MKVGEVEIWSAFAADLFLCRWQALWFFPTSQEGESPPLPKYDQLMSDLDSVFLIIFSIFLFNIIIAMCEKARAYANTVDYWTVMLIGSFIFFGSDSFVDVGHKFHTGFKH